MDIHYRILETKDVAEGAALLAKVFPGQEPITSHLKVSAKEFLPFATALVDHAVSARLSWIAIDAKTGRIAGLRVVTRFDDDFHPVQSFGPKLDRIFGFLQSVSEPLTRHRTLLSAPLIHSHMVAVVAPFQGRGIAKELLRLASKEAHRRGYRYSIGEVTNQYNRQILACSPGYRPLNELVYADYEVGGERPFAKLKGHDKCVLFSLDLHEMMNGETHVE